MAISQFPTSSGGGGAPSPLTRVDVINSTTTWTHPDGASEENPKVVFVQMVGGGGAGGYGAPPNANIGPAPSGGSTTFSNVTVLPGTGGYPARNYNGTISNPSTGGKGGTGASTSNTPAGSGADFGTSGNSVHLPIRLHASGGGGGGGRVRTTGGSGGQSIWGVGGVGGDAGVADGANSGGPGTGGGGGGGATGTPGYNNIPGSGGGGAEGFEGYFLVEGDVSVVVGAGGVRQETGRKGASGAPGQVRIYY